MGGGGRGRLDRKKSWNEKEPEKYPKHNFEIFFTLQPYIYCIGVIGTGTTMVLLPDAETGSAIYSICAVSGVFSACFIGIWNSLIKDEVGNSNFYIVYSHSLGVCGVVQFLVTILVVFLVQTSSDSTQQNYGQLMVIFGCIMAMAAIPIFGIMFFNALKPQYETPKYLYDEEKNGETVSLELSSERQSFKSLESKY